MVEDNFLVNNFRLLLMITAAEFYTTNVISSVSHEKELSLGRTAVAIFYMKSWYMIVSFPTASAMLDGNNVIIC